MNEHVFARKEGGEGNMSWIQATCSCGWVGIQHFSYNDTQYTDFRSDWDRHAKSIKEPS